MDSNFNLFYLASVFLSETEGRGEPKDILDGEGRFEKVAEARDRGLESP